MLVLRILLGLSVLTRVTSDCPDLSQHTVDLNLSEWTRASWYVQYQQINPYQPVSSLYCVVASYSLQGARVPWFNGTVVSVYNQNNRDRVNGSPNFEPGERVSPLCGRDVHAMRGKLSVAPCFLPNAFAGPYWVVALANNTRGEYIGAAVIGGNPTVQLSDGCTTPNTSATFVGGNSGLWVFARQPVAEAATVASLTGQLRALGVSTSQLMPVDQEGCSYAGFFLKPSSEWRLTWGWGWGPWVWMWISDRLSFGQGVGLGWVWAWLPVL